MRGLFKAFSLYLGKAVESLLLHKALDKYKCKALNKPLMLNHFLTYNFGKVKKWYKGSQNTPNVLNINALHILKGSRKLHTIDHVSLITY